MNKSNSLLLTRIKFILYRMIRECMNVDNKIAEDVGVFAKKKKRWNKAGKLKLLIETDGKNGTRF